MMKGDRAHRTLDNGESNTASYIIMTSTTLPDSLWFRIISSFDISKEESEIPRLTPVAGGLGEVTVIIGTLSQTHCTAVCVSFVRGGCFLGYIGGVGAVTVTKGAIPNFHSSSTAEGWTLEVSPVRVASGSAAMVLSSTECLRCS